MTSVATARHRALACLGRWRSRIRNAPPTSVSWVLRAVAGESRARHDGSGHPNRAKEPCCAVRFGALQGRANTAADFGRLRQARRTVRPRIRLLSRHRNSPGLGQVSSGTRKAHSSRHQLSAPSGTARCRHDHRRLGAARLSTVRRRRRCPKPVGRRLLGASSLRSRHVLTRSNGVLPRAPRPDTDVKDSTTNRCGRDSEVGLKCRRPFA